MCIRDRFRRGLFLRARLLTFPCPVNGEFDPSLGPARAKRITIMCEKMPAAQALDWGLVDELADDGRTVEKALEMAEVVLSMPQPTVRMIKEAVNATANALHSATSFADADQSQLTASSRSAKAARETFRTK